MPEEHKTQHTAEQVGTFYFWVSIITGISSKAKQHAVKVCQIIERDAQNYLDTPVGTKESEAYKKSVNQNVLILMNIDESFYKHG